LERSFDIVDALMQRGNKSVPVTTVSMGRAAIGSIDSDERRPLREIRVVKCAKETA
jgi:hypothetical protein